MPPTLDGKNGQGPTVNLVYLMAVCYNLAIDCAENVSVANRLAKSFDELAVDLNSKLTIKCRSELIGPGCYWGAKGKRSAGGGEWFKVCVEPVGMSQPDTADLLTELNVAITRRTFYDVLRSEGNMQSFGGYRAAFFGCEAQDTLGDEDWLDILAEMNHSANMPRTLEGLIVAESAITNESLVKKMAVFATGYRWWEIGDTFDG